MRIVIDEIPPSLNRFAGRMNVWEYRAAKERWKQLVEITYYGPDKRRRDPDNYAGKLILDGLTARGVIEDDSFNNIELILRGGYDKNNPRTEIEIMEAE